MTIAPLIPITISNPNQIVANNLVQREMDNLAVVWQMRQRSWLEFWANDKAASDLQAQVDLLAANLPSLLAIANATGNVVAMARPDLWLQAVPESSATVVVNGLARAITPGSTSLMPSGQPYMQFVTAGWYFTTTTDLVTHPCGMVFSTPVNWWKPQ